MTTRFPAFGEGATSWQSIPLEEEVGMVSYHICRSSGERAQPQVSQLGRWTRKKEEAVEQAITRMDKLAQQKQLKQLRIGCAFESSKEFVQLFKRNGYRCSSYDENARGQVEAHFEKRFPLTRPLAPNPDESSSSSLDSDSDSEPETPGKKPQTTK